MSLKKVPVQGFEGGVLLTCWSPTGDKFAFLTGSGFYFSRGAKAAQALWIYSISDGKQTKIAGIGENKRSP